MSRVTMSRFYVTMSQCHSSHLTLSVATDPVVVADAGPNAYSALLLDTYLIRLVRTPKQLHSDVFFFIAVDFVEFNLLKICA